MFDEWLNKKHNITLKTFELRGVNVQQQMIDEYNTEQEKIT
jgi:hypothetical protein